MQEQREWFYPSPDGTRTVGPLSTEQVAERLRSGELKDDDFIWGTHFEDQTWKQINAVAELIPHLPKPKALPPRLPPPPIPRTGLTGNHNVAAMAAAAQAQAPAPAPDPVPTVTLAPAAAEALKNSGPSVAELVAALQDAPPAAAPLTPQSPLAPSSSPMPSGIIETRPASEAAAIASEQPSIAAPPSDLFVPELETTNPSFRYKADPTPAPASQQVSGVREIDPTLLTAAPIPMPAPVTPKAPEPAPVAEAKPVAAEPARAAAPAKTGQTRFKQKSHPSGATSEAFARTGHGHEDTERELKAVAQHADQPAEYSTENAYRRYPRVPIRTEVIMRDDSDYFRFRAIDISEKGIRIGVDDTTIFGKGEEVTITVRNAPGIGTFSCRGVVMRILKREEGAGYGIIFMQLNPVIRRSITRYVLDQLAGKMSRIFTKGGPQAA